MSAGELKAELNIAKWTLELGEMMKFNIVNNQSLMKIAELMNMQ